MAEVIVIGGGLSGLSAAYELDRVGITYTLIEVKRRVGGSIASQTRDGFILDAGPMLVCEAPDAPFLDELGLREAVTLVRSDTQGEWLTFNGGTGTLIDVLARPTLSNHRLMQRMAVSTIGADDREALFYICMENGMVLNARAVIVAAPARYAERIFHTLNPEISFRLLDYRYDTIARLSLGYRDLPHIPSAPPADYPITYIHVLDRPPRVPTGHVLVQAGLRYVDEIPADAIGGFAALMGWDLNPVTEAVSSWEESDPLMWRQPEHISTIEGIRALLPDGVALAGSDYVAKAAPPTLQDRIDQGKAAAQRVAAWLNR